MNYAELPGAETALRFIAAKKNWPGEPEEEFSPFRYATKEYNSKTGEWDEVGPHYITYVSCNDFFFWGSSDAERVTEENIHLYEQTIEDLAPLQRKYYKEWSGPHESKEHDDESYKRLRGIENSLDLLFCARSRGMRPQGAYYKHLPEELWPMFDACGPERETGFGNPRKPGE